MKAIVEDTKKWKYDYMATVFKNRSLKNAYVSKFSCNPIK